MIKYLIAFIVIISCCVLLMQKFWNFEQKYNCIDVHFDKHKEQELRRR